MTIPPITRRIPIIGNTVYNVGQVIDLAMTPCNEDPVIAVYGFFNYVPRLVWSLVKPDPVDFFTDKFGVGHTRKRKRRFHIADVNPGSGPAGGLGWRVWRGIQLQQRIGWYFLVVDATTDFLINWTSLAMVFSGCEVPGTAYQSLDRRNANPNGQIISPGGTTVGSFNHSAGSPSLPAPPAVRAPQGSAFMVTGGLTVTQLGATSQIQKIAICRNIAGFPEMGSTEVGGRPPGNSTYSVVYRQYQQQPTATTYVLRIFGSGSNIAINAQYLQATGTLERGHQPDP